MFCVLVGPHTENRDVTAPTISSPPRFGKTTKASDHGRILTI